jgi:hypothetical protein
MRLAYLTSTPSTKDHLGRDFRSIPIEFSCISIQVINVVNAYIQLALSAQFMFVNEYQVSVLGLHSRSVRCILVPLEIDGVNDCDYTVEREPFVF